ncbi:hypothetical protein PF002_g21789, partial [Phytophthora fragariae]
MARTHKTAYIKEQMAERARQEEEARRKFGPHATAEGAASTGDEEEDEKEVKEEEEVVEEEEEADEVEEDADKEEDEQDDEDADEEEEEDEEDDGDEEVEEDEEESAQKKQKKKGTTKGKKCTVSDVEDEDLVHVPAFKAQHDSWSLIDVSLQEYMEATRQMIVIAEVINVARRNADLRKQVRFQGLQDSEIPRVPDKWEPYQRKYICTHGWKAHE